MDCAANGIAARLCSILIVCTAGEVGWFGSCSVAAESDEEHTSEMDSISCGDK